MSQRGSGAPGTGVKEVIDLLDKTPLERLRSLTRQLGSSTEEDIVHALCLFILQRQRQGLDKLQTHDDNILAKRLSEKWQQSARNFESFKALCDPFQESESLATLARIFKILTQHGLCDRDVLIMAYTRALPRESSDSDVLEYDLFLEEAKQVCGPEFVDFLSSFNNLNLSPGVRSNSYMGNNSATTGSAQENAKSNVPTSLHSSYPSYPSHLEISEAPTVSASGAKPITPTRLDSAPGKPMQPGQSQSHIVVNPSCQVFGNNLKFMSPQPPADPNSIPEKLFPPPPAAAKAKEETEQEEEEVRFYPFVILHAQQDIELAEAMKERLQGIIQSEGATFSEDFEVPGKSTLKCVEDAIENSAFTLLLLTTNFNSFLEMKTNSALVNSLQNPPKHNTVIPLLPQSNGMPRDELPLVLKTLVPLDENKNFARKIQKAMSPARIKQQKEEWTKKQEMKSRKNKQEKLKCSNQQQQKENEELRNMHGLEQQRRMLLNERYDLLQGERLGPDGRQWQQHPNISIANAQYIIIGDNSQMTVDLSRGDEE
ncbi:TIR domain-containing adapter molecule 1-like [Periophthalmus magnuspinnatus]|uniref:TIR domain-containing adapter molecule 1-like n=1 Tax=Periophthalmus magnuspinnatus TaxID=409849 RepID=UPI00145B0027|nr:TIR domain-containing adapter molecule 1-like [Periophthalmus magnuspinnatus]XP_055084355.1 TIR domain-containing adapter molecule 1-like [Periophthalmus magnuspinnatus]